MSTNFVFFIGLLITPSNVLPLQLKQTFPPIIWIFTEVEGDGIESRLHLKIFTTLLIFNDLSLFRPVLWTIMKARGPWGACPVGDPHLAGVKVGAPTVVGAMVVQHIICQHWVEVPQWGVETPFCLQAQGPLCPQRGLVRVGALKIMPKQQKW